MEPRDRGKVRSRPAPSSRIIRKHCLRKYESNQVLNPFGTQLEIHRRKHAGMTSKERSQDRLIESAVRKNSKLAFHVNSGNEHCVEIVGRERKGSLWVRPRYSGYRIQTTGQAQRLDDLIESLCGKSVGSAKAQVYQYWYTNDASAVEKIIDRFATLA